MIALDLATRYTHALDSDALTIARQQARGCYQRALVEGSETWSGAGLRGRASSYARRYARSRAVLRARLEAAGLHLLEVLDKRGTRRLVISSQPFGLSITYSTHGETCEARIEEGALLPSARLPRGRKAGVSLWLVA